MSCQDLQLTKSGNYQVALIQRDQLIDHEMTVPENTAKIKEDLEQTGILNFPVVVEKNSNIILDGHHRFEALGQLNVQCIPCYVIDINDNRVNLKARRKEIPVKKESFVDDVLARQALFPPKTTKFEFIPALEAIDLPIKDFI